MNENIPMNQEELAIRNALSPQARTRFDDMYYCRALGAASNIRAISEIFQDLARNAANREGSSEGSSEAANSKGSSKDPADSEELVRRIRQTADYFIRKRGESSYAIVTAIGFLTRGLDSFRTRTPYETHKAIEDACQAYREDTEKRLRNLKSFAWQTIRDYTSILVFDYSSTVNAVMEAAAENHKTLDIYVPESRILDGGHQFLRNGTAMGHRMHYIPDADLNKFIARTDAAFIGAETFYPDGWVANTAGSDIVGILCRLHKKPLFVPTTLIKLDPRGFSGYHKEEQLEDGSAYFGLQLEPELRPRISIDVIGLVLVDPADITGFITEYGVIAPGALAAQCRKYMEEQC